MIKKSKKGKPGVTFRRREVTPAQYEEAARDYLGWCCNCESFSTGCCEPDARRYECESCGERTVFGAEEALMSGMIELVMKICDKPSVLAKYIPIKLDGDGNLE
jgi:hypothetical protein